MIQKHSQLSVFLVDDEKKACDNLSTMLYEFVDRDINILGCANNTLDAGEQITRLKPNAVFLDIEMPDENAFDMLERLKPVNFEIVFVTAYDEYAIKAIKLNALDYLLKPISIPDLQHAVQKIKDRAAYKKIFEDNISYSNLSHQVTSRNLHHKVTLKDLHNTQVVDFRDIYLVRAQGSYARVIFSKNMEEREMLTSVSIAEYEEILPRDMFFRIHRSYLVNCLHVSTILNSGGNQAVVNGHSLTISRRRYIELLDFLKKNNYRHE